MPTAVKKKEDDETEGGGNAPISWMPTPVKNKKEEEKKRETKCAGQGVLLRFGKHCSRWMSINWFGCVWLDQCFQPCSWRLTNTTHFPTFTNQTHLNQLISSLVKSPGQEIYWSDKGDIQNVHCWCASRTGLGNTGLDDYLLGGVVSVFAYWIVIGLCHISSQA